MIYLIGCSVLIQIRGVRAGRFIISMGGTMFRLMTLFPAVNRKNPPKSKYSKSVSARHPAGQNGNSGVVCSPSRRRAKSRSSQALALSGRLRSK